jgi:hypothetical protein
MALRGINDQISVDVLFDNRFRQFDRFVSLLSMTRFTRCTTLEPIPSSPATFNMPTPA